MVAKVLQTQCQGNKAVINTENFEQVLLNSPDLADIKNTHIMQQILKKQNNISSQLSLDTSKDIKKKICKTYHIIT